MNLISKINEITKYMKKNGLDVLFIGTSTDLEYLTGLSSMSCERLKVLVILKDGRHFFICPQLYYEETRQALGDNERMFVWSDSDGFLKSIEEADQIYHLQGMNIGVNDVIRAIDMIAIQGVISGNFLDGSGVMENVRQIKDKEEMKLMKRAAQIADEVAEEIINFIKPGLSEGNIAKRIKELFIEKGADDISFEPIVASGPNSSKPHYNDDKRIIEDSDIIVLDFGGRYQGYCSDMSRTIFLGKPSKLQEEIYNIVNRANTEAELYARKGVTAADVDKKARDIINEAGYGQYFLNRTGHGIGMAVHETPYIKEGNGVVLENGMVFSIEPGIYISGQFGMRIEYIVLIENGVGNVLNKFTKDMICL